MFPQTPPPTPSTYQAKGHSHYAGTGELWANEAELKNYNLGIVKMLARTYLSGQRVLEFGAGIGSLALLWRSMFQIDPVCVEIDTQLQSVLRSRGFDVPDSLEAVSEPVDLIYTSNVLEHIEDDVSALKQLRCKLRPDGWIAVYVPAMMVLYSDMDTNLGHYRRYGRRELIAKLHSSGFEVQRCHYSDSLGFFAWGLMKMRGQSSGKQAGGGKLLTAYDRYIYPVSRLLDWLGARHLFGKNIYALARRGP